MTKDRFVWLDFARGLSALLVCAGHLRAALWVDYHAVANPAAWQKVVYFLTGLGHQAVIVFFVLSGFLVGGSVLAPQRRFDLGRYFVARLSRLWMVLIPALLFTALVDHLIGLLDPGILSGDHYSILSSGPQANYSDSACTFLFNVVFLQTIASPVFGTNGPLWSLANEFWYYFMFPFIFLSLRSQGGWLRRALCLSVFAASFFLVGINFAEGFVVWLFGVLAYRVQQSRDRSAENIHLIAAILAFLGALVADRLSLPDRLLGISGDWLVGGSFATLLVFVGGRGMPVVAARVSRWFSDISYTLYLFHFPLVVLFYAAFVRGHQLQPEGAGLAIYAAAMSALVVSSYLLWFAFERNTEYLRRWMERLLLPLKRLQGTSTPR